MSASPELVLASTSPYRRALLARLLTVPFRVIDPQIDETPAPGEPAAALAARLAAAKARAGLSAGCRQLLIGSDQVAERDGTVLGKPGDPAAARRQLLDSSGRCLTFHTAVCVLDSASGQAATHVDRTTVRFRQLQPDEIDRYLAREPAWDCAGSFKSEGLGISLMASIETRDPTALQGLPLIWLAQALRDFGLPLP
ncbi:MAG: septum formation protein Maf [Gammaproteobacteria bacterium]|nr:MAG: septum formation protein Maf [Gammaproteobacteria bacterium]